MTHSANTALLGPEFDAFLFAQVHEEGKGVLLSVLSALARSDVDPWQEAAELARMPREVASQRLTALIAALPDGPAARLAPATIADRLIKLLPPQISSSVASRERLRRADPTPTSRSMLNVVAINLLVMAVVLCAQLALASLQPPTGAAVHIPASGTVVTQTPQADQLKW
jgi:hypothetical protein